MKVLEISTSRIWGGGKVHLRTLCFGLLRQGHDVLVACRSGSPVHEVLAGDGLPTFTFGAGDKAFSLARLAFGQGIEIIHAHQSKGARLAVAACRLAGRPQSVLTRHALGPPDDALPTHGLDRVIAVSRAAAKDCIAAGFAPEAVSVVPNGVDTRRFRPGLAPASRLRLGLPVDARLVVLTGRLSGEKGCAAALRALLPLLRVSPLCLLILGDGEQRPRLERLVRQSGMEERVLFLGHQPDVRPFLAAAESVVAPGPREAFGLAMLEAMAMGCPVVAVEAGGVPEVITDGLDGLLVPPGNELALAAAVYRLTCDPELRQRIGDAARQRALAFSAEEMVGRTEGIFGELIDSPANPTPLWHVEHR